MKTHIAVVAAMASACAANAFAETFRDPQGRFEINVPAGWTAEPFDQGLQLKRGAGYCLILPGTGAGPEALLSHLTGQFGSQWSHFQQLKQGNENVGGQQAPFSLNSGVNRGVPSFLKVTAVAGPGQLYGIIAVIPETEFAAARPGLDQIAQSFRLSAGGRGPAPYGQPPSGNQPYEQWGPPQGQPMPQSPYGQPPAANQNYEQSGPAPQGPRMPPAGTPFVGIGFDQTDQTQGATIAALAPGAPAEQAGLQPGDRIVSVARRPVSDPMAVVSAIGRSRPGDTLEFGIVRNGQQIAIRVKVAASQGR